jgi:hypothetical protein
VPVQGCTLPLPYSRAILLLPLWAVQPVQNLSACARVHFTFLFHASPDVQSYYLQTLDYISLSLLFLHFLHLLLSITLLFPFLFTIFLCCVMSKINVVLVLCQSYTSSPPSLTASPSAPLSPHSFSYSNPNILRPLTFIKNFTFVRPSFHFI